MNKQFKSFKEFYPYYLSEHKNPICRGLHYIGSMLTIILLMLAITTGSYLSILCIPIISYGFAWVGHFIFEKNKPASFKYPCYSFIGDWVMFKDFLIKRIKK